VIGRIRTISDEHGHGLRSDVVACPEHGGGLRLLVTIDDPAVIDKILRHRGLAVEPPAPLRARTPASLSSTLPIFDGVAASAGLWSH
jgi:hypothetical protein